LQFVLSINLFYGETNKVVERNNQTVLLQPANSVSLTPNQHQPQHQPVSGTFFSQQISISHQPQPAAQSE